MKKSKLGYKIVISPNLLLNEKFCGFEFRFFLVLFTAMTVTALAHFLQQAKEYQSVEHFSGDK